MAETTPSSPALLRIRHMLGWLGQAFVLAYLTVGLSAVVSAPIMGLNWLQLSSIPLLTGQTNFNFPYFIGLIFLASGFWIFIILRHLSSGLAYGMFAASSGIVLALLFDVFTTRQFITLWTFSLAMAGGSLIELVLLFPSEDPMISQFPWLKYAGYTLGLTLAILSMPQLNWVFDLSLIWIVGGILIGAGLIFALLWTSLRRLRIARANEREQIRMVLLGELLGFGPFLLWLAVWVIIAAVFRYPLLFSSLVFLPVAIFPILCSYAFQRYRLVQTDYVLSQATLYGLLAIFVTTGYALLVGGLGMIFSGVFQVDNSLISGLVIFLIAIAIQPLRQRLQNGIDTVFFRGQRAYQEQIQGFSGELTNLVDIKSILQTLRKSLEASLRPADLHIFLYDALSDQYIADTDSHNRSTSDLGFSRSSSLVSLLSQTHYPLFLGKDRSLPACLNSEKARITILGAQLFAPLSGRQRLTGWLALGERLSGEPYTSRELAFMDAICDQAALAIERAQEVVNLETRVRETNTLAKVAQGVNITLTASREMPARCFRT